MKRETNGNAELVGRGGRQCRGGDGRARVDEANMGRRAEFNFWRLTSHTYGT